MVPVEALSGLDEVKARAVGLREFGPKEAVVWTIFSHLLQTAEAAPCWKLLSGEAAPWPSALIFGGEALGDQAEYSREQLIALGHGWAPDVLLEQWPGRLTIVVARYLKPFRESRDSAEWRPILADSGAFGDSITAQTSGRIDLARAWRLGWDLAARRQFTLIDLYLVPERAAQKVASDLFRASLADSDDRHFRQISWRALLGELPAPWPEWLTRFVAAERLR